MHMKEDHMRNSQLKPGYNMQIGVEAEYIVGIDISSERSDQLTFIPFMEKLNKNLPKKINSIVADAGYECENCDDCQHKSKCTKAKSNKRLDVSNQFVQKKLISLENITSLEGIMLRMNRSIQVEGAFGVLKEDHGFRRFLTRGKKNVKTEFTLLCFAYNINKFHNKIQQNRCGILLHQLKVS